VLKAGAASVAALAAGGCRRTGDRSASGKRILTVWHPWGGVQGPRFEKVKQAFEKAHPDIEVSLVYTQNDTTTNQKFFTAVAAGTPPDVTAVDGPQVASWAEWGALEPLTPWSR
jgi:fructooligosaccharide transport system substrate-binding protein